MQRVLFLFSVLVVGLLYTQANAQPLSGAFFNDPLQGTTLGTPRGGEAYLTWHDDHVTFNQWNTWIKYVDPARELPSVAGTLSFWLNLGKDFEHTKLISDAYNRTQLAPLNTTWPTFFVLARKASADTYLIRFGYWNADWHWVGTQPVLQTGQWYHVGVSWGPLGQSIWVFGEQHAYSPYTGPRKYGPTTPEFKAWGLGAVLNKKVPHSVDPETTEPGSAHPASFANLGVWARQVPYGGTAPRPTPKPEPEPTPPPPRAKVQMSTTFQLMRNGVPVPGATLEDLKLEENIDGPEWREAKVLELKETQEKDVKRRVILAIDCSGSMNAPVKAGRREIQRLQAAKQAALDLVRGFNPDDQIGLVTFSNKVELVRTLGPPDAAIKQAIMGIESGTSTAYYDAVLMAIRELGAKTEAGVPRGVIVLTDGRDTDSKATADDVAREAKAQTIPVFTCGFGLPDTLAESPRKLAEATGGTYTGAQTLEEVVKAFEGAFKLLSVSYTMKWESNLPPGVESRIRIQYRPGGDGMKPIEQDIKVPEE